MCANLSVFYCFPRSGATLLNKCLLCAPENVVLSEVNPAESVVQPEQQAHEWFKLLTDIERTELRYQPYLTRIEAIRQKAVAQGKKLCIRDWSGINFLLGVSPWHGRPSYQLEQRLYLHQSGYTLREAALIRRSKAVYESIRENISELVDISLPEFKECYSLFLNEVTTTRKFYLEQFLETKSETLNEICATLNLNFPSNFTSRFHTIKSVTGNNTLPKPPKSATWTSIRRPKSSKSRSGSKYTNAELLVFDQLDDLAGYTTPDSH
jgi:hypothetical protein